MEYILPKKLEKGNTIAFIAPAGSIKDADAIHRAKKYFEGEGYNVVFSKHLFNQNKYMSDTDENRLFDLHQVFGDKNIDAVICARGGYGTLRLIDKIDYNLIKSNPKLFCGYSDITILSTMFLKKAGLITYSGPMARGDFGMDERSEYTINNFFNAINGNTLEFKGIPLHSGDAEGIMFGGNLASIASLCGTDFIPNEDFIFFTEDLNEPVYKIDKMFTQLLHIENFRKNIKGIIAGDFLDSGYPEQLDELLTDIGTELDIPTIKGFKITHETDKITIPVGKKGLIKDNTLHI